MSLNNTNNRSRPSPLGGLAKRLERLQIPAEPTGTLAGRLLLSMQEPGSTDHPTPRTDQAHGAAGTRDWLGKIDSAAVSGRMDAFGSANKAQTLRSIDVIRQQQMEIFARHMELEMSFPSAEGDFSSKDFCEHFQGAFKQKEAEMDEITTLIRDLNTNLDKVNTASSSNGLPRDPSEEEESPRGAKAAPVRQTTQTWDASEGATSSTLPIPRAFRELRRRGGEEDAQRSGRDERVPNV